MPEIAECYSIAKNMPKVGKVKSTTWSKNFKFYIDKKNTLIDLKGFTLKKPFGYGKSIWIPIESSSKKGFIVSQLGMSGGWFLNPSERNTHLEIRGDKNLFYIDPRMFGKMNLFLFSKKETNIKNKVLEKYNWGVEPITNPKGILPQLKIKTKSSRMIKDLLLDQSLVFGIGNYLASEILFDAKISPFRKSQSLTSKDILRLDKSIKKVIAKALASEGFSFGGGYLLPDGSFGKMSGKVKVYGESGSCKRNSCSGEILSDYIKSRITYFCDTCQN